MRNCLTPLFAIMAKEVQQVRRDRLTLGMIAGIPLLLITLFGYAIDTDVRHLSAAVADQADTQLSRRLIADAQASQVIKVIARVKTAAQLQDLLDRGEIYVGLLIPPDFEQRLVQPDRPAAQLLVSGSDPTILGAARGLTAMSLRDPSRAKILTRSPLFEVR